MRVISYRKLREAAEKYGDIRQALDDWYNVAKCASWRNILDVRQIYPHADPVGNFTVFNIKGNDYRLIVGIDYQKQIIFIKYILTHAQYDKEQWKNDPHF